MMKVIVDTWKEEPAVFCCAHYKNPKWPPWVPFYGQTAEQLRASKTISEADYQSYLIWHRVCGLLVMDMAKCRTCPHVRRVEYPNVGAPVMVTMDGKLRVPAVDVGSCDGMANRGQTLHLQGYHSIQKQASKAQRGK
jgi:hypothetical protein